MAWKNKTRKAPHHTGSYHVASARVRAIANASPLTVCWRCGKTLAQHDPHKNGKPARWQAGHILDGVKDGPLAPEASTCNTSAGARLANRRARANQYRKQRTEYTW